MHRLRKPFLATVAVAGLVGLAACAQDASFKDSAEKAIEDDEKTAPNFDGLTFDDAACDEPVNDDVNTNFNCTATSSDGAAATFVVTITSDSDFSVKYTGLGATPPAAETTVPAAPPTSGG